MKRYASSFMWLVALAMLYFMDVSSGVSLCFFRFIGISFCPGCGIGHAIHYTMHFQFKDAMDSHILGIPSTLALSWLVIKPFISKHTQNEPTTTHDAGTSA